MPISEKEIKEALAAIMEQAQVFASTYALIGSRFDTGQFLEDAEEAKTDLRKMIETVLLNYRDLN